MNAWKAAKAADLFIFIAIPRCLRRGVPLPFGLKRNRSYAVELWTVNHS